MTQGAIDLVTDQRLAASAGGQVDLGDRGVLNFWVKTLPVKSLRVLDLKGLFKLCLTCASSSLREPNVAERRKPGRFGKARLYIKIESLHARESCGPTRVLLLTKCPTHLDP